MDHLICLDLPVVLRCAIMQSGAQSVAPAGTLRMLTLCANNWDGAYVRLVCCRTRNVKQYVSTIIMHADKGLYIL